MNPDTDDDPEKLREKLRAEIGQDVDLCRALSTGHPEREALQARIDANGQRLLELDRAAERHQVIQERSRARNTSLVLIGLGIAIAYGGWGDLGAVLIGVAIAGFGLTKLVRAGV